jgi:hypothetical protein
MEITIDGVVISSDNSPGSSIRWCQEGYAIGEIRLFLGTQSGLSAITSPCTAQLVVYDAINVNGVVWGNFEVAVVPYRGPNRSGS